MGLRKSITVFQAGYANGLNGWNACGYGHTIEAARKDLEVKIHLEALSFVRDCVLSLKINHNITHGKDALGDVYRIGVENIKDGRYVEKSYQEDEC